MGQIHGRLQTSLAIGDAHMAMTMTADLVPRQDSKLAIAIGSFRPAAIRPLPPALAMLSQIDTPVSLAGSVVFDAALKPRHLDAVAELGTGQIVIGQGVLPFLGGAIALSGTMDEISMTRCHLDLAQNAAGPMETLDLSGTITRISDRIMLSLAAAIDQIAVADVPRLWPAGLGGGGPPLGH